MRFYFVIVFIICCFFSFSQTIKIVGKDGQTDKYRVEQIKKLVIKGTYECLVPGIPPEIIEAPNNREVCEGDSVVFKLRVFGSPELFYQWYFNDNIIEDATNSNYKIKNVAKINEGFYYCSVKNVKGTIQSKTSLLQVKLKPSIYIAPITQTKTVGDSVTWYLSPGGEPPFYYQWKKNEINIPGATDATLKIKPIKAEDDGTYYCIVKNNCGIVSLEIATLNVEILYNIEGFLTYGNSNKTPLVNDSLFLVNNEGNVLRSTITYTDGYFKFSNLKSGTFFLKYKIFRNCGGINPVDALFINKYFLGIYKFTDYIKQLAADVLADSKILPTDALYINRYFLGIIKRFTPNEWVIYPNEILIDNKDVFLDIKAICVGDVNGSYIPK
ncbi:MAG: immunoglobulin domain-containing protein [Bacteroidales bacterium]|nr:immunoglobulin domain-containing protein [Bacteroidales bacterium]